MALPNHGGFSKILSLFTSVFISIQNPYCISKHTLKVLLNIIVTQMSSHKGILMLSLSENGKLDNEEHVIFNKMYVAALVMIADIPDVSHLLRYTSRKGHISEI